jgi:hypothetical protein
MESKLSIRQSSSYQIDTRKSPKQRLPEEQPYDVPDKDWVQLQFQQRVEDCVKKAFEETEHKAAGNELLVYRGGRKLI